MADEVTYSFPQVDGPNGTKVDAPKELVSSVTEFAKGAKLTQEQATAFFNAELKRPVVEKAPESYTFAKIKEGDKEIDVAPELVADVSKVAKELGLTQKQAQLLMNREVDLGKAEAAQQSTQLAALKSKWNAETKADPEIGGAKFDENMGLAKRALAAFFPKLVADANKHPFLDHPQVVRGLVAIGKLIGEDGSFISAQRRGSETDVAKIFYPGMN